MIRSTLRSAPRGLLASTLLALVALLAIPTTGRAAALTAILVLSAAPILVARSLPGTSWAAASIATLVGLGPATVLLGAITDLTPVHLPTAATRPILAVLWIMASVTLGRAVARHVAGRGAFGDAWIRATGAALGAGYVGLGLARLLLPDRDTPLRLAWLLGEEDNAAFIAVAREVIVHGPDGAHNAVDLGAAFMNLPRAVLGIAGGPLVSESDPRLQAITLTVVSALMAIALAAVAMALLAGLPHHVHATATERGSRPPLVGSLLGGAAAASVALAGSSLLVVLPLQTGFLTFLWGLSLVILASAVVAVTPRDASVAARAVAILHLAGTAVLLLGSWPFILTTVAPLALLPLLWVRRTHLASLRARGPGFLLVAGLVVLALLATTGWVVASLPQVSKVLELGQELLLITGSGIGADAPATRLAILSTLLAGGLLAARARPGRVRLLALLGPILGGAALLLALRVGAEVLADGELRYAGIKLLFGLIALMLILGGLALVSTMSAGLTRPALVLAIVLLPHLLSETATAYDGWWDRVERPGSVHAIATVDAIRASSPEVPIRCLPAPGTTVDGVTRWAAYFCVRWVEQGFNEGRFDGNAFRLLEAEGETFERTVEEILAEFPSEYLFAYRMTMGPGWFGWTG